MPAQEFPSDTEVSFPSPQTFSIIPSIHALLLRLQAGASTAVNPNSASPTPAFDAGAQQSPLLLKDLPSAAAPIRLKITKAKATVDTLPDIDRTVEEQEEEIQALEARIHQLKTTLASVGNDTRGEKS